MANLLPILLLGGAAAVVLGKKKKKKKTAAYEPEAPDELPLPEDEEAGEDMEPPPPVPEPLPGETAPGETGFSTGAYEGPTPGKSVANGVERHFTGAYPWKILFTEQGDYAAHSYPMGPHGPHEEVARGATVEAAIAEFKFWATNEDRRKRNLPPLMRITAAKAVTVTPARATFQEKTNGGGGGLAGG